MNVYWYPEPDGSDQAEVEAWRATNDCSDVVALAIGPTTVIAYGTKNATRGWGTSEMRERHPDLRAALTVVCGRLHGEGGAA